MVDLFHFVLWLIGCLLFVKLVKLDFAHVFYVGLDWWYVEILTRNKREQILLMFRSSKFTLHITILRYLRWVWPWIRALSNKVSTMPRVPLSWAGFSYHLHITYIVVLDGIICFSERFYDNSLLKMRFQVLPFESKKVQGCSSDSKIILMSLLSVLFHLQNHVSGFQKFNS